MLLEQLLLFRIKLLTQILNVALHVCQKLLLVKSWLLLCSKHKQTLLSICNHWKRNKGVYFAFKHVNHFYHFLAIFKVQIVTIKKKDNPRKENKPAAGRCQRCRRPWQPDRQHPHLLPPLLMGLHRCLHRQHLEQPTIDPKKNKKSITLFEGMLQIDMMFVSWDNTRSEKYKPCLLPPKACHFQSPCMGRSQREARRLENWSNINSIKRFSKDKLRFCILEELQKQVLLLHSANYSTKCLKLCR